jgi:hypothetical protein
MSRKLLAILIADLVLAACQSSPIIPTAEPGAARITPTSAISGTETPSVELTLQALQANIREATQMGAYHATRLASTPSRTPRPTATVTLTAVPSPTLDPSVFYSWSVFESEAAGIRFEYPTYFSLPPFTDYGCAPFVSRADDGTLSIDVGERVWVSARPYDVSTTTLNSFGESQVADYQADPDTQVTDTSWGWVARERAFTIEYRFGGLGRYGVETYFAHHGTMYAAVFSAGATCGMTTIDVAGVVGIDDSEAYGHMLRTWQFLDSEAQ